MTNEERMKLEALRLELQRAANSRDLFRDTYTPTGRTLGLYNLKEALDRAGVKVS